MDEGDNKIIDFAAAQTEASSHFCKTCGGAKQRENFCERCAVRLMDIALSDLDEDRTDNSILDCELYPTPAVQKFYDHYEICTSPEGVPIELGRGAMGITYKAIDIHLECPVALKIVNTRSFADSAAAKRLLQEARAAARLSHPNIASIHHLGLNDEKCYYSMEYIEGETLEAFVQRSGPLSLETALEIVVQVSRALRAAHEQQLIHRDIKPTNIMLRRCGGLTSELLVKVIDFGLVKTLPGESSIGDPISRAYFAGTPLFASPEQLQGQGSDARSDIHSLGVCLFYMLTGTVREMSLRLDHVSEHSWPENVIMLLRSMVAVEPAIRPQTAADLLEQTSRCLAEVRYASRFGLPLPGSRTPWLRFGSSPVAVLGAVLLFLACWGAKQMSTSNSSANADNLSAEREARILCDEGNQYVSRLTRADNQRAMERFSKALARSKDFADAYAGVAAVHFQNVARFGGALSELDLATENAQHAISLAPSLPRGYHALGIIRTLQGRPWEALAQLRKAVEVDSHYLPGIRQFGALWVMVGQPQMGKPWLELAGRMAPTDPTVLCASADACVDLCLDEEAIKYYRRCLAIVPTSLSAHCGLMHIHLLEGNFSQANEDFTVIQSIEPEMTLALTLKAQLELFQGNYEEAERVYRSLLAKNRTGNVTYYGGISYLSAVGFLRLRCGDSREGESLLGEAVTLHLESEGSHGIFDLSAIRAIQGRKAEALSALQQAATAGWLDYRTMRLDPRFDSLKGEPEFNRFIESLAHRVDTLRTEAKERCRKQPVIADYPVAPGSI